MSFASSRARRYVAIAATAIATSSPAEIQITNSRRIERARMRLRRARFRDHPAYAADIADRLGAQLAAQRVDVHFDGVALDFLVPAVELLFELRARKDRAG